MSDYIEIRYPHGSMVVNILEFLEVRSITKLRKLLKVIRSSNTPECETRLSEFIQKELDDYDTTQKMVIAATWSARQELRYETGELARVKKERTASKGGARAEWDERVRYWGQKCSATRQDLRELEHVYKHNVQMNTFYKKAIGEFERG